MVANRMKGKKNSMIYRNKGHREREKNEIKEKGDSLDLVMEVKLRFSFQI